jgi:phage FluMu protein Com
MPNALLSAKEVLAPMKRPVTCRHCGKVLREGQVVGVSLWANGQVYLHVHFRCSRCHRFGHMNLPPERWAGATLVWDAPVSEMTPEEAEVFRRLPPITADDVLEFYEALKFIDRLPRALLERPPRPKPHSAQSRGEHP